MSLLINALITFLIFILALYSHRHSRPLLGQHSADRRPREADRAHHRHRRAVAAAVSGGVLSVARVGSSRWRRTARVSSARREGTMGCS